MDLGIEGKVAIVTGGSNGIGRAAAERFSICLLYTSDAADE